MKKQAIAKSASQQTPNKQDKQPGAHVGNDSLVGENTELGEKTNVKRSVIDRIVRLVKRTRLQGV